MLLYFTVSGFNDNINFARLEVQGNKFLEPLNHLLVLVPQHQRLVELTRTGDSSGVNNLEATTNLIEKNFQNLEKVTKASGETLKITPSSLQSVNMEQLLPAQIINQWQMLQSSQTSLNQEQLNQQYNDLTERIRRLITRVGNTSNLILDPDLDSYYLMDVVLLALPQAQQRVGEILWFGETKLQTPQLTNEAKVKLEIYASSLRQTDLERIEQGISTSLQEDKNYHNVFPSLQQNIPPVLNLYKAAVIKFNQKLIQLATTGQGNIRNQDFFELGQEVIRNGSELWNIGTKELNKLLEKRIQDYENTRFMYLVLSLAALAIASFFVFRVSREISVRLTQVVAITKDIARGNLTPHIHVDSHDEIGQLLIAVDYMAQDLSTLIRKTQESGIQVSSSATQLRATTKRQEVVVINQAESTSDVLKAVMEISQLIDNLASKMGEVASKSDETAEFASSGQSDLVQMEENMQNMENASNNVYNKLKIIKDRGDNITSVVTTMAKIADKINILSLNAAIEAEKAGEYGQGFAVVSREIRRLADQTAVAALEIKKMVNETQLAVSDGVIEIESFLAKVCQGVADISKISTDFTKIIEQVQALSPNFEAVSMAMQNQSENTKKINDSMLDLGQGMQQIKNTLWETYSVIEQLNEGAIALQERVSRFQVNTLQATNETNSYLTDS
ncbi:MAG: methyl-accepting chemotaxis protein [Rhizonema sp. NSF051]|nr:methyl-accepting chemotaxis protein [Rhizonema sp. NSF051]